MNRLITRFVAWIKQERAEGIFFLWVTLAAFVLGVAVVLVLLIATTPLR